MAKLRVLPQLLRLICLLLLMPCWCWGANDDEADPALHTSSSFSHPLQDSDERAMSVPIYHLGMPVPQCPQGHCTQHLQTLGELPETPEEGACPTEDPSSTQEPSDSIGTLSAPADESFEIIPLDTLQRSDPLSPTGGTFFSRLIRGMLWRPPLDSTASVISRFNTLLERESRERPSAALDAEYTALAEQGHAGAQAKVALGIVAQMCKNSSGVQSGSLYSRFPNLVNACSETLLRECTQHPSLAGSGLGHDVIVFLANQRRHTPSQLWLAAFYGANLNGLTPTAARTLRTHYLDLAARDKDIQTLCSVVLLYQSDGNLRKAQKCLNTVQELFLMHNKSKVCSCEGCKSLKILTRERRLCSSLLLLTPSALDSIQE